MMDLNNSKNVNLEKLITRVLFFFICSVSVLVYANHFDKLNDSANEYFYEYCIILFRIGACIITLHIFGRLIHNEGEIYNNDSSGIPFLITYATEIFIVVLLILNKIPISKFSTGIIQISLMIIMLFSSRVCKIKIPNFFHKIKRAIGNYFYVFSLLYPQFFSARKISISILQFWIS